MSELEKPLWDRYACFMNKLSFEFIKEHFAEDRGFSIPDQIVALIDGKEQLLDFGYGMFPSDFFSQDKHFFNGKLQIGICGCSCYVCCDQHVDVNSTNDAVVWSTGPYVDRTQYTFDRNEYTETINRFTDIYKEAS